MKALAKTILSGLVPLLLASGGTVPAAQPALPAPLCKDDPKFHEQDFTIGQWEVFRDNVKTADVKMEPILGGCYIQETWTSLKPGGAGSGLFAYSRKLGDWGYFWISESGNATSFRGALMEPGNMRFTVEDPTADGGKRLRQWSLILQPDGRIREWSVGTEDGGKSWTVEYSLTWVKKH